ncbi:death ligand signal enhancer isoform X2 [Numida meleagris]|uniref:death ligand signal enhancer isoform X2 n=1 Tax=Numida meleagris TaxID=8996 RepID=UPI000B3D9689|nr:death ligand signal enhancer isoform X2 [Numida meleagris]
MVRASLSPRSSRPQGARSPFPLPSASSARQGSSLYKAPRRSCRHSRARIPPNLPVVPPSLWPRGAALLRGRRATRPLYGPAGGMWRLLLGRGGLARCLLSPTRPAAAAASDSADGRGSARCCCAPECQHGRARDGREREGRRQPLPGLVPRCSVLDAVTWGALAALLLQLVRQISWLRSLPDARREPKPPWLPSLPAQHTVVPDASAGLPCAQLGPCFLQKAEVVPENSSSGIPLGSGESQPWVEEGEFPVPQCSSLRPVPHSTKAAFYYYLAASSCHPMAQYRYARCLLCHSPESEWHRLQKAVTFLEQAAVAGLTEAQAYLGVFYMRGLQPKEKRGLKYLLLAAKNGDAQSRYHVGVCYEKGLGVQQNLAEAMRHYRQSAAAGNRNAQERLRVIEEEMEDVQRKHPFSFGMRTSSSSPCFWATERMPAGLHTFQPRQHALTLPHSWSADRLYTMTLGSAEWSHALGNRASPLELQGLEPHHCGY